MKTSRLLIAFILLPLLLWTICYHLFVVSRLQSHSKPNTANTNPLDGGLPAEMPLFILHVGPPKTGTSTIQGFAATHDEILRKDNIYYLGHYGKRSELNMHEFSNLCRKCEKKNQQDCECTKKWKDFEKLVNSHHSQNHNVMVSDETFYRYKNDQDEKEYLWDHMVPLLKNWRVRIVFTYRRYWEWVPSTYHQSYNPAGKKRKETRETWPDEGGLVIPDFPDFMEQFMTLDSKQPAALKKKWESHFSNIWVFNMHADGPFLRNFFCRMIPEAPKLCSELRSKSEEITKNPSSSKILHFDMLAVKAYKLGLIKAGLSRTTVNKAIRKLSDSHGFAAASDFPQKCLSKRQAEKFLKRSLDVEKNMVPKFYSTPEGEAELRAKFAEANENGKFCSVDVEKVLKDEKWQSFFKELRSDVAVKN